MDGLFPMRGAQNIPLDDAAEQMAIQRRMKIADALRQQSSQDLQPTMVGNQLVAPSPLQHIARALAGWQANRADSDVMGEANRYADSKRQRIAQAMAGLKNADSPEAMMATGAQLMSVPGAEQMGQNLYMTGAQQARSAHLMDKFFPQSGQAVPQGAQAPMPQGQPLGSVDLSGGQPAAAAPPMAPQASAPQSGFDERRYLAMLATNDPTLAKAAEEYKARTMIPAAAAANLDWEREKFHRLSAAQQAEQAQKDRELKLALARLGIDTSKLHLDEAKAGYEFGYGGATPGVMPGQSNAVPSPAAPTGAPTSPAAAPANEDEIPPGLPPKMRNELAAEKFKKEAEGKQKRLEELPKAKASYQNTMLGLQEMENTLSQLGGPQVEDKNGNPVKDAYGNPVLKGTEGLSNITGNVAGRSWIPNVRETSTNSQALLDNLKGKIMLQSLMNMKELSQNGASGFGALNESEGKALRESIASLDQLQGTPQFTQQLGVILNHVRQTRRNIQDIYDSQYAPLEGGRSDHSKMSDDELKKALGL